MDLSAIPIVDGHCHPLLRDPGDVSIETFLDLFSEGRAGTMREHVIHTGYYRRALHALAGRLGANPLLLRSILEDPRWASIRLVLLHMAYPYTREAAFMTAVCPQVHLDLSLALPFLSAGEVSPLIEILSLAPSSKLMYGSDVSALPELFALTAEWGRAVLGEALEWLVEYGDLDSGEAGSIARAILSDNARALYAPPIP